MQIMDNPARYGAVTRAFHWSIAGLILWQLLGMVLKVTLGRDAALTGFVAGGHASLGFVLFVMIVLRVLWAGINLRRRPAHDGAMGRVVRLGHAGLYALMLAVPGLALLRAYGGERGYAVFGWQIFAPRAEGEAIQWMVDLGSNLHGLMGWALALLVAGHIAMALLHRLVLRDGTMQRMTA